ncbi:MAG: hypothetical protein HY287_12380 [Planctomycetes bacterium]|nr:hypothetical protein [Planctomycetota bacterium]MBI3835118.1 hypothetical protein [Planctomycetota bacterium]
MTKTPTTPNIFGILILGAASHCFAAPPQPFAPLTLSQDAADTSTLQAVPLIETTGFESPEWDAFTSGQSNFMCGSPYWSTCTPTPIPTSCSGVPSIDVNCCSAHPNSLNGWYVSQSSQHCHEPHIDTANPANPGGQHLRFARDSAGGNPAGCVGFDTACRVNAFTPDMGPQFPGPTTISWDLSISNTFGQNFEYFTVGTDGGTGTIVQFEAAGSIYIYDASVGVYAYAGPWLPGGYRSFRIDKDPCIFKGGLIRYYYDDRLIYQANSDGTATVQRAIMQTDNGGAPGEYVDVDNYEVYRNSVCETFCGNGILELYEECEPGIPGLCPPGRCIAAGQPGECTCRSICTLDDPCILHNGENGPFIGPLNSAFGGIFTYTSDGVAHAFSVDFCGSAGTDTPIYVFGSAGGLIASNQICCDPSDPACGESGMGSTPSASCYDQVTAPNYEGCTCVRSFSSSLYFIQTIGAPIGTSIRVNINKLASCDGIFLGSCCDTNGLDAGCSDDVEQTACVGPDKHWNNEKCADVSCNCQPNCQGGVCGSDGCGGSCGDCDNHNVCDGMETCDPNGQCVAGTSLNCDDGLFCNGMESCNPNSGCHPGAPPNCSDGMACTIDQCNEAIRACTHTPNDALCDDGVFCNGAESCTPSGCAQGTPPCTSDEVCNESARSCSPRFTPIPTVSQWGLVVIAVVFLIAAKVAGRRNPA